MAKAEPKGAEGEARRTYVSLPLAQLVPGVTRPAFKKRSPAGASLMADWVAIVGPTLAARTEPRKLSRAQLTIACSGPVAMELQHAAAALIERINTHAGTRPGRTPALRPGPRRPPRPNATPPPES
ncbi:MAG: DUF721 domain-containing protein [Rhodospirillales bacterium]